MEIGILGAPQSGKSTLFQIMTGVASKDAFGEQFVKGIAKVADARFDKLVEIFKPAKVSPATIPFIDVNAQGEKAWDSLRQGLNAVDGILHIVDGFTNPSVDEMVKRYRALADELALSDQMVIENRLEKLAKIPQKTMKPEEAMQAKWLPKAKEFLELGKPLRELTLTPDEVTALKGFSFWSMRPELIVINIAEGGKDIVAEFRAKTGLTAPIISICCQIEAEIAALPPADQKEFLASLGIETAAFQRIVKTSLGLLKRMFYFTVGEDEVKAWVIPEGSTAPRAAAAIHKDFERGFIKAEVVSFDDFIASGGTLAGAKSAGKFRLEGKEYIVRDGDIINFRFNV